MRQLTSRFAPCSAAGVSLGAAALLLGACTDAPMRPTQTATVDEAQWVATHEPHRIRDRQATLVVPPEPEPEPDVCTGVQVEAGANLRAVLDGHGPGTTYCIHAGTYDVGGDSLLVEDGDQLIGDPVQMAPAPEGGSGPVLTSVPTKIVGHSPKAVLFVMPGGRATLENLDVSGAVAPAADSTLGGIGVWLSGSVLRRSRVHDNEGAGVNKVEPGFLIEDSEIFRNGSGALVGKSAGGVKITAFTGGGVVRRTYAHDNVGNGLWTDCGATNDTLQDNTVVRNTRKGIHVEISAGPIHVLRNVVMSNNTSDWSNAAGIVITSSTNVRVQDNRLADNRLAGIVARNDARSGNSETLPCRHGFFTRDIVITGNALEGDALVGCTLRGVTCSANTP